MKLPSTAGFAHWVLERAYKEAIFCEAMADYIERQPGQRQKRQAVALRSEAADFRAAHAEIKQVWGD